jgi:hypothetical protein
MMTFSNTLSRGSIMNLHVVALSDILQSSWKLWHAPVNAHKSFEKGGFWNQTGGRGFSTLDFFRNFSMSNCEFL